MGEPMTHWQSLAVAADEGQLYLDEVAAEACSRACDAYIDKLIAHQKTAKNLSNIVGWGEFKSGQELREFYSQKAVGGHGSMVDALQSHIDTVMQMQAVFRKFFVDTTATDDGNAADLGSQGPR
nr:hypothetical protein [Rhodococcus sp. (in: high G+C Gram-positive bacteria)]